MILNRIISLVIGYFCGIILIGYAYSKAKNKDITTMGSGNAGTTNTYRVFGWKAGVITLLGDMAKTWLAIALVWVLFQKQDAEMVRLLQFYAGLGSILGHNYPFYMLLRRGEKKKGGKGIACTAAMVIALLTIEVPVGALAIFGTALWVGYVSLGSIIALICVFIQTIVFGELGVLNVTTTHRTEIYIIMAVIMVMGIWRHHENIKRLMNGTENKFSFKKKEEGTK